jgi:hypothetical protein
VPRKAGSGAELFEWKTEEPEENQAKELVFDV